MHYKTIVGVLATVGAVELKGVGPDGVGTDLNSHWNQIY